MLVLEEMTSATTTEVKRGRGRPPAFPDAKTKMAGFNLPVETLELLSATAKSRELTQNAIVDRAVRAYCRTRKS